MPLRPLSWSREPAARPSSTARTWSVSPTVLSRAVWPKEDGEGGRDEDSPEPATRPPVAQRARVAGRLPYVHAILCPVACLVGLQHRKFLTGHPLLPPRTQASTAGAVQRICRMRDGHSTGHRVVSAVITGVSSLVVLVSLRRAHATGPPCVRDA